MGKQKEGRESKRKAGRKQRQAKRGEKGLGKNIRVSESKRGNEPDLNYLKPLDVIGSWFVIGARTLNRTFPDHG